MKLKTLLILFFLQICFIGSTQVIDTCKLIFHYKFSHLLDTNLPEKYYQEDMMLHIGSQIAVYQSMGNNNFDSLLADGEKSNKYLEGKPDPKSYSFSKIRYYNFYFSNQFYTEDRLIKDKYLMVMQLPKISWEIKNETKNIIGFDCQKATGVCKGRKYTAWFTKEIPIPIGPWKLNGLPGIILEAKDEKQHISFTAYLFEKNENKNMILKLPKNTPLIKVEDYKKAKDAYNEDPIKFMQNSTGINFITPLPPLPQRKKRNNSIELSQD